MSELGFVPDEIMQEFSTHWHEFYEALRREIDKNWPPSVIITDIEPPEGY